MGISVRTPLLFPENWHHSVSKWLYERVIEGDGVPTKDADLQQRVDRITRRLAAQTGLTGFPQKVTVVDYKETSDHESAYSIGPYVLISKGLIKEFNQLSHYQSIPDFHGKLQKILNMPKVVDSPTLTKHFKELDAQVDRLKKLGTFGLDTKLAFVIGHEMAHGILHAQASELRFIDSLGTFGAAGAAACLFYPTLFVICPFWSLPIVLPSLFGLVYEGISWITALPLASLSRLHEFEADEHGIQLMKKAGFDPRGALWTLQTFGDRKHTGYYDSHPCPPDRIEHARITLARLGLQKHLAA